VGIVLEMSRRKTGDNMRMTTYGDWFSGFGGMTIGAKAAGLDVVFGGEYRQDVADVYEQNLGDHVKVCDLTTVDVATFPYVDVFHASPPCPNFCCAKIGGVETVNDKLLSEAIANYIKLRLPKVFTLENVYGYRKSKSWLHIARTLQNRNYSFNYWHVNMANYGVPQTRQRMIVIARRDGKTPMLPETTHAKTPRLGLFGTKTRWIGWYEAIEDLIPTLPDSQFAPWQLAKLPRFYNNNLIMDCKNSGSEWGVLYRHEEEPTKTIQADQYPRLKAFIMNESNPNGNEKRKYRLAEEPAKTATAGGGRNNAYANGRVVKMTPRAIARFQSFPDWYVLPDKLTLACYGLGNAVPPLFAQKLYQHLDTD